MHARHVLSTTGATLVSGGLGLALTMLVARSLTPDQNGHYAQFVLVFNIVYTALNLGLGPATTFFVASRRASAWAVSLINLRLLTVLASLVVIASLTSRYWGLSELLERMLKIPASMLYGGIAAGMLLLSFNQVLAVLMGCHRYDLVNMLNVSRAAITLLLVGLITLSSSVSIVPIAVGHSAGFVLALALALWVSRKVLSDQTSDFLRSPEAVLRSMLGYGGLVYLSNILHYLAMRGLLLLLSYYNAPESVGFYSLALILLEVTLLLPSAIGQLVFPQSSTTDFDHGALETMLRVNLYVSLLLVLLIFLFARPVIVLLIGAPYAPVAQVLVHLTPSIILLALPRILSQLLSGQGHPGYPLFAAAVSFALGALLAIWAIPNWGLVGAAWVTNLVSAVTAAVTVFGYSRAHGVPVHQLLRPRHQDWLGMQRLAMKLVGR